MAALAYFLLFLLNSLLVYGGKKITPEEREAFHKASGELFFLTSFNYDQFIKQGTWAVFYGLRACTHCMRFTPVWRELELVQDGYKPVRIAKVECMAEDRSVLPLCDWVNGFPSIYLHHNGVFKEEMLGDLNYNLTLDWLKSMAVKYSLNSTTVLRNTSNTSAMNRLKEIVAQGKEPSKDINPMGEIVHLTDQDFDEKTKGKLWFVMFHAPWCSHCKHLAPTWEELAGQVKGYINIGKVDATKESALAKRFGIDRFPMLKLYVFIITNHSSKVRGALVCQVIKASND
jgi:thiol-disulfide isomerase/thioredoxin